MKKKIVASDELYFDSFEDLQSYLWKQIGSRADILPACVCNLGDGGSYLVLEDTSTGEYHGMEVSPMSEDVGEDEIIPRILNTWK